jgi:hypothetical protein
MGLKKPDAYNPYAAGPKVYDGSAMGPNTGPASDKAGYMKRDAQARAQRSALMKKLEANKNGMPDTYGTTGMV